MTAVIAALAIAAAFAASAAAQSFTTPVKLTGASGGEPSIAADTLGNVFVVGPQGIPSGVNGEPGIGYWVSRNDATSFSPGTDIGSELGGGDSDVLVAPDNSVYVDDLEAVATQMCKSTDHGQTFDSIGPAPDPTHCSHVGIGQAGASDDRPWLTTDRQGTLYLTYHEFVSAQPLAFRSDNGGADLFTHPCGPLVTDPAIEANVPQDITGGTLVAKPVTDASGNLYVLFATTTQAENAAALAQGRPSGAFSQLYLAVSHDHCQSFTDYTVFDGAKMGTNTVQFGDIFNAITVDGDGNLYTVGSGYVGNTAFPPVAKLYLFSSTDHGQHWIGPTEVGAGGAHMLPAAVASPGSGQLALGYFHTINGVTDPNSPAAKWTYTTAETTDAASARPHFSYADVRPGFVYHSGEICNLGILCGTIPGQPSDRSLLDFTSAALDPHGCPLFTFAGNPQGVDKGTFNYVTRQTSDCLALSRTSATTHHKHKKKKKHHRRRHHRHHHRHRHRARFTG